MIAAVALATVVLGASDPGPQGPDVYAVIVGHNGGTTGLSPLRFADDDALRFSRWFTSIAPAANVWTLARPDEDTRSTFRAAGIDDPHRLLPPTRTSLVQALAELKARLADRSPAREAHVYFVYAGHGLGGRVLLEPEHAAEAAVTGRELRAWFAALQASRVLLFFDACRSQSLFADRGTVGFGPDFAADIDALDERPGTARVGIITAATSDKPAGETAMLKAGYFSHVLLSGLAGAADADSDGRVVFGELAAFAAFNTQRLTSQRPWFDPPGGDLGELVVDLRASASRLVFGREVEGHLLIAAAPGTPIFVEVQKARGAELTVVLPPGGFRVTRVERAVAGSEVAKRIAALQVTAGGSTTLESNDDFATAPPDAASDLRGDLPFDVELSGFRAPFTPEVVTALMTGYQAGREPSLLRAPWRHRLSLGYALGPAPLSLAGVDHGVHLSWRTRIGRGWAGARVDLHLSEHVTAGAPFGLRRPGIQLQAGVPLQLGDRIEVAPFASAGVRAIFHVTRGEVNGMDLFAPAAGGGVLLELDLADRWSVFSEARFEAWWVLLDGVRQPFLSPALGVGISRAL